ncbi:unnamed protein product [Sphagnum jensenii]|uniref:Uncharacterized protein n=1 Tax=Sphagnum jensenii TaxID=128206 RepID=A0ABP0VNJ8_9BRYO
MFEISSLGLAAAVAPETPLGRLVITPLSGGGGSAFCCGTPTMLMEQKRSCKLSSKMDNMKTLFLVTRRKAAASFLLAPVSSSVKCDYRKQEQQNKRRRLPQRVEAPPSTSFEVYGDVVHDELVRNAAIVKRRPLTNWNEPKGRSRVFAAWKQLQSWSSQNLLSNTHLEHVHKSSRGPLGNEAAVQPGPPKIRALNHNMQFPHTPTTFVSSAPSASLETSLRRSWNLDATPQASRATISHDHHVQNRCRSIGTMTAAAPPTNFSLSHEDLAVCKANFLVALKSSPETNETSYCAALVQASLATMSQGAKEAEQNANAVDSWLDMAEEQLWGVPSETDVHCLETMLDNMNSSSFRVKDHHQRAPSSRSRQLEEISSAVTFLASNLASMPKAGDIGQIRSKIMESKQEMARCSRATREAVLKFRLALMRGEVAWLKSLDVTTARLDAITHAMLP